MNDRLREEPATLFDLAVQQQAFAMMLSILVEALETDRPLRSEFSERLEANLKALEDNGALDWSEGRVEGALKVALRYVSKDL